jgi:hypothetical protein
MKHMDIARLEKCQQTFPGKRVPEKARECRNRLTGILSLRNPLFPYGNKMQVTAPKTGRAATRIVLEDCRNVVK